MSNGKPQSPAWEPLLVRVELRGIAEGRLPRQTSLERPCNQLAEALPVIGRNSLGWRGLQQFGTVTAWRVTLWEGQTLIGSQQSFLW